MKLIFIKLLALSSLLVFLFNPVLVTADYSVPYTADMVSFQTDLTMTKGQIIEYNVSITDKNSTMTLIVQVFNNTGPLWGMFLVQASVYYPLHHSLAGLTECCQMLVNHASGYTVVHLLEQPNPNYVLAFYDTHGHPVQDTTFKATLLYGIHGSQTNITSGPSPAQELFLFLVMPVATIFLFGSIGIHLLRQRKRKKNNQISDQNDLNKTQTTESE